MSQKGQRNAMKEKHNKTKKQVYFVCYTAIIAAMYVALTWFSSIFGLSSQVIQIRISEMLCVLPIFTVAAIPGVTIGCLISNLLFAALWQDIVFGTLATLIGAVGTYLLKKYPRVALLPPIISNTVIIPFVLAYAYHFEGGIPFFMLTVFIGEFISIYLLGYILYRALNSRSKYLFKY